MVSLGRDTQALFARKEGSISCQRGNREILRREKAMSKPKYLKPRQVVTLAAMSVVAGAASASNSGNIPASKIDQIKVFAETGGTLAKAPFVLNTENHFKNGTLFSMHYSHVSHRSHASHNSHQSHNSHSSHYSGY